LASDSDGRYKTHLALDRLPALDGLKEPAAISRRIADLLLAAPLPDAVYVQLAAVAGDSAMASQPARLARIVQAVATLPEFQLA